MARQVGRKRPTNAGLAARSQPGLRRPAARNLCPSQGRRNDFHELFLL